MAKIWDENMRTLVWYDPQAFVDLVLPGAHYVKHKSEKLRNWQLEVDALLDVVIDGKEIIVHRCSVAQKISLAGTGYKRGSNICTIFFASRPSIN